MRYYLVRENFDNGMDKKEHLKGEKLNYKENTVVNDNGEIVFYINSENYINRGVEVLMGKRLNKNDISNK